MKTFESAPARGGGCDRVDAMAAREDASNRGFGYRTFWMKEDQNRM